MLVAALVLGTGLAALSSGQAWALIVFLILFPPTLLGVFAWLVVKHHSKLYAPADFRDDGNFLQAIGTDTHRQQLKAEISETLLAKKDSSTSMPFAHKIDHQNEATRAVERHLEAERLVFRQLELEYGVTIQHPISLKGSDPPIILDGAFLMRDAIVGVEVKLMQKEFPPSWVDNAMTHVRKAGQFIASNYQRPYWLVLAIVMEQSSPDDKTRDDMKFIEKSFSEMLQRVSLPVQLRIFWLNELQDRFSTDHSLIKKKWYNN